MNTLSLETMYTDTMSVSCSGTDGGSGHPRVYMKMDARGYVDCGYCDRHFVLTGGPADDRQDSKTA